MLTVVELLRTRKRRQENESVPMFAWYYPFRHGVCSVVMPFYSLYGHSPGHCTTGRGTVHVW